MRRPAIKRVHARVRISSSETEAVTYARLRARTTDDALRLARHLGYERRAESVEVWVRVRTKRGTGAKDVRTCVRYTYEREWRTRQVLPQPKLILVERVRVERASVPKWPRTY